MDEKTNFIFAKHSDMGQEWVPDPSQGLCAEKVAQLLKLARCAPASVSKTSPWKTHLITSAVRRAVVTELHELMRSVGQPKNEGRGPDYNAFPKTWRSAWLTERLWASPRFELVDKLQPDKLRLMKWYGQCLHFLQAPTILLLTDCAKCDSESWLEHGCYPKNIIWAAEMLGLNASTFGLAPLESIVGPMTGIPKSERLICALSIVVPTHQLTVTKLAEVVGPVAAQRTTH
jgi:hypothetical protein